MPDTPSPIPFSTTILDHLPPGAHPLLLYAAAAATILLTVGTLLVAALILAALARRLTRSLRRPTFIPPRPLLAPWERHALAALRAHLPANWSVHPHVNPCALLSLQPSPASPGKPSKPSAHTQVTQNNAHHVATTRPIPFTITDPNHVPRAVIAVTAAKPTRITRRQDTALTALLNQHGIATLYLTPGTRPDWQALATTITCPPKLQPTSVIPRPSAAPARAALRAAIVACRFRRPYPDTTPKTPTHAAKPSARLSAAADRVQSVVSDRLPY